jgi:hypothetical protein
LRTIAVMTFELENEITNVRVPRVMLVTLKYANAGVASVVGTSELSHVRDGVATTRQSTTLESSATSRMARR